MKVNINILYMLFLTYILSTVSLHAQQKNVEKLITLKEKKELIKLLCNRLDTVYLYPENVNKIRKYLDKKNNDGDYNSYKTAIDFAFQLDKDL